MTNWEKEYREKFGLCDGKSSKCDCARELQFIRNLLVRQKEELREKVEGMIDKPFPRMGYTGEQVVRNQAIDDVLALLATKEK